MGKRTTRNSQKQPPKSKTKPTYKYCSETGDRIWFTTVTVTDIKRAAKTGEPPFQRKKQLVRVPSKTERQRCYEEAARALEYKESLRLPTFGGRPWKVVCKFSEPAKQKPPLFRWFRGCLELAVLPHFLEDLPKALETKGRTASMDEVADEDVTANSLCERPSSQLSRMAWNDSTYAIPTMKLQWISPNHKTFHKRGAAEDHAIELVEQQLFMDKILFGYGARGQKLRPTKPTKADALKAGKLRFLRDGLWVVGQEEEWQANRADELEQETKDKIPTQKRAPSALQRYLRATRDQLRAEKEAELKEKGGKRRYTLKEAETELRAKWKAMSKEDKAAWKEHTDPPKAELIADDTVGLVADEPDSMDEICRKQKTVEVHREVMAENLVTGAGVKAPTSVPQNLDAVTAVSGFDLFLHHFLQGKDKPNGDTNKTRILDFDADPCSRQHLNQVWKKLSQTEKMDWNEKARKALESGEPDVNGVVTPGDSESEIDSREGKDSDIATPVDLSTDQTSSHANAELSIPAVAKPAARNQNPTGSFVLKRRRPLSECPPRRFNQSSHWRLTLKQIDLCYNAALDHYEKVMNTVKARALHAELSDGFDVLRERGRGRYDMELPVFDTPEFSFLTNLKAAPWMPIVREILGSDVVLIHKGCFLSLPGADAQEYHQDGPHLSEKVQRPCHAINVFIPLVDLSIRNGPTEFQPGSHILGHDSYDRSKIIVPAPPAGTPVIFDYRLGHRGLGNSSSECRPIVYCTYAASSNGKEFRDSVNFSRKRYHRIGDMVEKPLSREERTKKRKMAQEERLCLQLIAEHEKTEAKTLLHGKPHPEL